MGFLGEVTLEERFECSVGEPHKYWGKRKGAFQDKRGKGPRVWLHWDLLVTVKSLDMVLYMMGSHWWE